MDRNRCSHWPEYALSVLVAHVPSLVRPLTQSLMAAPSWILLLAVLLGLPVVIRPKRHVVVTAAAVAAIAWGLVAPFSGLPSAYHRWTSPVPVGWIRTPPESRFGGIMVSPDSRRHYDKVIRMVQSRCEPDQRVFMAAPFRFGVLFLADRAPCPPYADALLAATPSERALMVETLARVKPPLALLATESIDIPLPVAQPEAWAFIEENYRLDAREGPLLFYVPLSGRTKVRSEPEKH